MKKVLIFHPTIAPYRVDFFNSLNSVCEMRLCLRYANLKEQKFDNYQSILNSCEFTYVFLRPRLSIGTRVIPAGVISQIKSFKPDIVIGIEYAYEVVVALLYRKLSHQRYKVLTMSDDSINMLEDHNDFTAVHVLMRACVTPHLDNVIVTSPKVKEWYTKKYGKGLYFPIIRNETTAITEYDDSLDLSNEYVNRYSLAGKTVFLYVGRLVELKRVQDIIKAFLLCNLPKSALVIVGSGIYEEVLRSISNNDSRILFVGRKEGRQLLAWYNIATALVLASNQEAFGAVTNEALIGGCDVIVSKQCGSSCLIEEGINGHIFNSGDIVELSKIMKMYSDKIVPKAIVKRNNKMLCLFSTLFSVFIKDLLHDEN